jgi:hypothetical protein
MTGKTAFRVPPLNRELGILAFNRRVLAQAADPSVPLLERLRFLTIVSSNLDEFFEIRVAGIKEQIKLGISEPAPEGMTPKEMLAIVTREARELDAPVDPERPPAAGTCRRIRFSCGGAPERRSAWGTIASSARCWVRRRSG